MSRPVTSIILSHDFNYACRLVIPLKKVILSEEELSRAIPALSERQFVVKKTDLSGHDLRTQRELFWYREALFNCIRGHWQEVSFHLIN